MILVGDGEDLEPPDDFLRREVADSVLNLLGDYRFLTKGYFVSLHAEECGCEVFPPVKNALDAYRAPLFMNAVRKLGLETPEFSIRSEPKFERGVLLPLNPFSKNSAKVVKTSHQYAKAFKRLSMNRYPVVQVKSEKYDSFNLYLWRADKEEYNFIAEKIFKGLRIPLGKVLVDVTDGMAKPFYFMPVEKGEINLRLVFEVLYENCLLR
ncbi:MAG: hypothetical protein XD40_0006 [Archaeoglobus fulgidus]|uniref:RimK-like ATPgrasp N-terminal domain-containing protein n=1 Tax=Archaeoglobus fulgidus TaxID=2234 RepID=A0A117KUN8_ARCFL|nr:RimK-like ATPgrasp N-terminal domain-containing protein [Archaeoglobus fulgidus]KUJ94685.1 MAG: hypothetical protein XD40_0006 [Archaeoglobus fulgidus]KUK06938.1 MAG: hypothetical protein XD48_0800 [Archaeoglobus fulgidus]